MLHSPADLYHSTLKGTTTLYNILNYSYKDCFHSLTPTKTNTLVCSCFLFLNDYYVNRQLSKKDATKLQMLFYRTLKFHQLKFAFTSFAV